MGPVDYLILLITVVTLVELIVELRRRRWMGAAVSAAFLILFLMIGRNIYVYLWQSIFGP